MSADDTTDDEGEHDESAEGGNVRERLEEEADRAVTGFDEGIVDLLSWVLETETRARIYVFLRQNPDSTSEEIANGTGLYPSTVREALAELHGEEKVTRRKRESTGAGNNPYEYSAMAPSDLVSSIVDDVQSELNTVFNLDSVLDSDRNRSVAASDPVTITVEDAAGETGESGPTDASDETRGDGAPDDDGDEAGEEGHEDETADDGEGDEAGESKGGDEN